MKDLLYDVHHAIDKLNGVVVKFKDDFYVATCPGSMITDGLLHLKSPNKKVVEVHFHSDDLKVDCGRLGYVNTKTGAFFVKRHANRTAKAGLTQDSLIVSEIPGNDLPGSIIINSKEFFAMLNNNYPTFDEALRSLKDIGCSIAFHRNAALSKKKGRFNTIEVIYRGEAIGLLKEGKVSLYDSKTPFISETILMELGLHA